MGGEVGNVGKVISGVEVVVGVVVGVVGGVVGVKGLVGVFVDKVMGIVWCSF